MTQRSHTAVGWRAQLRGLSRYLVVAAAAMPGLALALRAAGDDLGANPVQEIQQQTGTWAIRLLLATLAVTPLRRLAGVRGIAPLRRPLGLCGFAYALAHFLAWVVFDQALSWAAVTEDLAERRWIAAGAASFAILAVLAATSTRGWVRRLGRNWKRLHALVYPAAALAVAHSVWVAKTGSVSASLYGALLVALLAQRLRRGRRRQARRDFQGASS